MQEDVESSLSTLFGCATSDAKLGVQASFLKILCEQQLLRKAQVNIARLKEYGFTLAHRFSKAKIEDAKHAVSLLEALLCMSQMHLFVEEKDAAPLLKSLEQFALFFQNTESSTDESSWCEKARVCVAWSASCGSEYMCACEQC